MTENYNIFERIGELNKMNEEIKKKIKLLYIFRAYYEEIEVILVTNEDKIYCFGHNWNGVLGFGHDNSIEEFTVNDVFTDIEEFYNMQIIEFKNSECHTIARNSDGKLLCWGSNWWGCLGNGRVDRKVSKPEVNKYLINENIIDMCCGYRHTLVLTSNKEVYAWGDNNKGQIGNKSNCDLVSIPFKVSEFKGDKVKSISCGFYHSMALTESGSVYIWGDNSFGQLGLINGSMSLLQILEHRKHQVNEPKYLQMEVEIEKISCGQYHSLLLSCDRDIYVFGRNKDRQLGLLIEEEKQFTPIKLNNIEKFLEIESNYHHNISTALSKFKLKYYVWGKCGKEGVISEPKQTQFKSFEEVFVNYLQVTHRTWDFSNETEKKQMFERSRQQFSYDGLYEHEFKEEKLLGYGSFGEVYKVFHSIDDQHYAMKKIILNASCFEGKSDESIQSCLKEIRLMVKLKSDFVVHYIRSWIEKEKIFYIQMELCYKALNEVLKQTQIEFKRKECEPITLIEYYISSELFKETLEALNYLHKQDPPIIHRDLNPANILITNGINGRFVKLADFGLSVIHEFKSQSHSKDKGHVRYIAPETNQSRYDTKADIFSLGVTTQELFYIDVNTPTNKRIDNSLLKQRYENVYKYIEDMMSPIMINRPDCEHLLCYKSLWYLDLTAIESDSTQQMSICDQSIEKCFHKFFIKTKLNYK